MTLTLTVLAVTGFSLRCNCWSSVHQQLELQTLQAQLSVCDGAIHHLVLLRTETCAEPDRQPTLWGSGGLRVRRRVVVDSAIQFT